MAFQDFAQLSARRKVERQLQFKKRIVMAFISTIVLVTLAGSAIGVVVFYSNKSGPGSGSGSGSRSGSDSGSGQEYNSNSKDDDKADNAAGNTRTQSVKAVKTMCKSTDYQETCETSLLKTVKKKVSTSEPKDLVQASMVVASEEIDKAIHRLNTLQFETPEKKAAHNDCLVLLNDAKDELNSSISIFEDKDLKSISAKTPDVNNWLSAVLSYQHTCIDGMPEGVEKNEVEKALNKTKELSSNSLAIVSTLNSILQMPSAKRRLLARKGELGSPDEENFPTWMNQMNRRMLKADNPTYTPNVTVSKDGTGNFTTINAALKALPSTYEGRYVIFVKEGIYEENVVITKKMVNLTIYGVGSQKSIITGSKNKADGLPTFDTATFVALGDGFWAQSIGFRNTAGAEKHQAVALRVQSDYSVFLNCRMESFENTLFAQTHRQYYRSCYITGTVDIIFGDAAAVFQNCKIYLKKPADQNQQNTVTAQGRVDKRQSTGFVLHNSGIFADETLAPIQAKFKSYLGRPLKAYSRTIVMETDIADVISPEGWVSTGDFALKTLYFGEFGNKGLGAESSSRVRVKWPGFKAIDKEEAMKYTVGPFIQGDKWLTNTDFPVQMGLLT